MQCRCNSCSRCNLYSKSNILCTLLVMVVCRQSFFTNLHSFTYICTLLKTSTLRFCVPYGTTTQHVWQAWHQEGGDVFCVGPLPGVWLKSACVWNIPKLKNTWRPTLWASDSISSLHLIIIYAFLHLIIIWPGVVARIIINCGFPLLFLSYFYIITGSSAWYYSKHVGWTHICC
jgi:hypothetical protein